jgi:3-dehydro-L-gulonate 2-dehydrogenase
MKVSYETLDNIFTTVLVKHGFTADKAALCAEIFAGNSRDGVHSHGVNRFPVFVGHVKEGLVSADAEPETTGRAGVTEYWNGNLAPGMYTATLAMRRAAALAEDNIIGFVAVKNTNHWMRGGTYGWQAAEAGYIGICATNTIANMPAWGGTAPSLGNNPLVIAIPRQQGHIVLDMAMSQFSYGKLQEYQLSGKLLPVTGGYDETGMLTNDPHKIKASRRTLPIGYWKGAGLSLMIDLLVAGLSGGRSVAQITSSGKEFGLSQLFVCIKPQNLSESAIEEVIRFTKNSGQDIRYPGEQVLITRKKNMAEGIEIHDEIWEQVMSL